MLRCFIFYLSGGFPSSSQNFQMAALAQRRVMLFSASRSIFMKFLLSSWRSAKSLMMLKSQSLILRGKSAISSLEHSCNKPSARLLTPTRQTYAHVPAGAVVLDVHVLVLFTLALRVALLAQAPVLVDGAVGRPGFVVVGADLATVLHLHRALGDAHALGFSFGVGLAHAAGAAVHVQAGICVESFRYSIIIKVHGADLPIMGMLSMSPANAGGASIFFSSLISLDSVLWWNFLRFLCN